MLSLFANLIYYFPGELALPHIGELGMSRTSWVCPRRELGVPQTSGGKSRPRILIVIFFFSLSSFFLSVCVRVSVTEFSEVLPPFFPPPTFSFVRRVGGVVVVVGGWGGTYSGTWASTPSSPVFPLSLNVVNEWKCSWLGIGCLASN